MTFQPPSMGVQAQAGMNTTTTSTPGAATEAYEFLSESLTSAREIVRTDGIRGTRLHPAERVRLGRQTPGGTITMQPTYAELVNLLPRIIGAASAQSGYNTYTPSDTVPVAFQTIIDRVAKVFTYTGCRVSKATFKGSAGQPLELSLDIEALTESQGNAGTFATLTISQLPPFVFTDGALTFAGTTYQVMDVEITIDWHLKTDRFMNSITRTDLPSTDLTVEAKFTVPYTSDTTALFDGAGGVAGVTGNMNFSYLGAGGGSTGVNLAFAFANLIFPARESPAVASKDEITLTLEGEARGVAGGSPLVVTLDSTP